MKDRLKYLILAAVAAFTLVGNSHAQSCTVEAEKPVYQKFLSNYNGTPEQQKQANGAAQEYLEKFGECPSDAEKKVTEYLTMWSAKYDIAVAEYDCVKGANDATPQSLVACQTFAAKDPENLKAYLLLSRILLAHTDQTLLRKPTVQNMRKALDLIAAGKTVDTWYVAENQAEAKGTLEFYIAYMTLDQSPTEAAAVMHRLALSKLSFSKYAGTYYALGTSIFKSEYKKSSDAYIARCGSKEVTPECTAEYKSTMGILDRAMDAFARAVAYGKDDPKSATFVTQSRTNLAEIYKQTHNGSEDGIDRFIADVLSRPLP